MRRHWAERLAAEAAEDPGRVHLRLPAHRRPAPVGLELERAVDGDAATEALPPGDEAGVLRLAKLFEPDGEAQSKGAGKRCAGDHHPLAFLRIDTFDHREGRSHLIRIRQRPVNGTRWRVEAPLAVDSHCDNLVGSPGQRTRYRAQLWLRFPARSHAVIQRR